MFINYLNKFLKPYSSFVISLSGGLDSMVLLHQLIKLKKIFRPEISLRVLHIHHNLSIQANDFVQHCIVICKKWKLNYKIIYINVPNKRNIEAIARDMRYTALLKELQAHENLVTAHNLNDKCETFFLSLKRGSGPSGLSSIQKKIVFKNGIILRPFLNFSRDQLETYAKLYKINWIEDKSNKNIYFERNFIRHKIIPLLTNRWPFFLKAISRSASLCQQQEILLNQLLSHKLSGLIQKNGSLYYIPFMKMTIIECKFLIRRWIYIKTGIIPSYNNILHIYQEIIHSKNNANPELKIKNFVIRRYRDFIWLLPYYSSLKHIILPWDNLKKPLILPQNLGIISINNEIQQTFIRQPKKHETVSIRFQANGYFLFENKSKKCKLKKIWNEKKIPPWERSRIPMLYYNDELISIINFINTKKSIIKTENLSFKIQWKKNIINS
ncbi:tRNA lysidine(34) synthetase TilS [Candidatus Tachikawaea gelatinosa]|uniref:tRNA(Ile)-lysidine synthase n=1 Tax=Candidatus Tachikawaea gelatinosa TaxID=1410383 RepID=A0A090AIZ9_9ENTR|nr:tRNA lysidine(34) synthetase TilS [Candidatus Tachikawaea gelatinosa]BAP58408.1 tRNA(Ile)-lysidine synthase [Candidatus Tachikawaea gelatinosa]